MTDSARSSGTISPPRHQTLNSPLGSSSITSRPFLNLLNPLSSRNYRGYSHPDELVEEDDENEDEGAVDNHGEGPSGQTRASWLRSPNANTSHPIRMHPVQPDTPEFDDDDDDGEVPQSFMIETRNVTPSPAKPFASRKSVRLSEGDKGSPSSHRRHHHHRHKPSRSNESNVPAGARLSMPPRPSELQSGPAYDLPPPNTTDGHSRAGVKRGLDDYERALWNWVNVYNLDAFLQEVYAYYTGKGIWCIALARGLNLLTVGFVIGFSSFLLGCVDYSMIPAAGTARLGDVIVPQCVSKFSGFTLLFFVSFGAFWIWNIVTFVYGIMRLLDMYRFYTYLLDIPDADIQTISWPEIVRRIGKIRESNPVTALSSAQALQSDSITAPLDAHDIANRIMRQENYLIALFNKELLNLRFPLPVTLQQLLGKVGLNGTDGIGGSTLTKALEWNLRFCLLGFLFDADGRVRRSFVTQKNRTVLIDGLKRRFIFMGCLNAIFAPFIVLYLLMYSFFRYFDEYHKNPSSIGGRQYTPFAQWKFREFNELPHLFKRRLHLSYPAASEYIDQFPNEKMAILMKFVSFVAGSFAAVLVLASLVDPDLFLHFEITPHRTVVFYLGVFASVLAVTRGMIPDDHRVFDTEELIREVIRHTHYMPNEWNDQLHSKKVHTDFGHLFEMKVSVFLAELLSVLLTPFILWFALPLSAPAIIDFFREFSVHVDGLGYVCSFAVFDFKRHGNTDFGAPTEATDERYVSKEGKMEKSFLNFKAANPDWNPTDPSGSLYLSRLAEIHPNSGASPTSRRLQTGRVGSILANSELRHTLAASRSGFYPGPNTSGGVGGGTASVLNTEQRNAERARMYDSALARSVARRGSHSVAHAHAAPLEEEEDDVESELGESYIRGIGMRGAGMREGDAGGEGDVDDVGVGAGVMGLLGQIYDQRRRVL